MQIGHYEYPVPQEQDDWRLAAFFEYWLSRRGGFSIARRIDIDPTEIPKLLGYFNMIKIERDGTEMRFRFTLWGTMVAEMYGGDFTGKYLEEVMLPAKINAIRQAFMQCVDKLQPHYWAVPVPRPNRHFIGYRRLVVPLATVDGRQVSHLMAMMIPTIVAEEEIVARVSAQSH